MKINHYDDKVEMYKSKVKRIIYREISFVMTDFIYIKEFNSERNNFDDLPPCVIPFKLDSDFA